MENSALENFNVTRTSMLASKQKISASNSFGFASMPSVPMESV